MPINSTSHVTVAFQNIRSLRGNTSDLSSFITLHGVHIMALAETWLDSRDSDESIRLDGFQLFCWDRSLRRGGGVAAYVSETINARRRSDLESDEIELLWIEVSSGKTTCLLGVSVQAPRCYHKVLGCSAHGAR